MDLLKRVNILFNSPKEILTFGKEVKGEGKCFDFVEYDQIEVKDYLLGNPEDHIVLVNIGERKALCFSRSRLVEILNDRSSRFIECVGREIEGGDRSFVGIDIRTAPRYIRIPADESGLNVFIPEKNVKQAIRSDEKIFCIVPLLFTKGREKGIQAYLTHTVTEAVFKREEDFVSANHCQKGSNLLLSKFVKCVGVGSSSSVASEEDEEDLTIFYNGENSNEDNLHSLSEFLEIANEYYDGDYQDEEEDVTDRPQTLSQWLSFMGAHRYDDRLIDTLIMVDTREGDWVEFLYTGVGSSDFVKTTYRPPNVFSDEELESILRQVSPKDFEGRRNRASFERNPLKFLQNISGATFYSVNGRILSDFEKTLVDLVG